MWCVASRARAERARGGRAPCYASDMAHQVSPRRGLGGQGRNGRPGALANYGLDDAAHAASRARSYTPTRRPLRAAKDPGGIIADSSRRCAYGGQDDRHHYRPDTARALSCGPRSSSVCNDLRESPRCSRLAQRGTRRPRRVHRPALGRRRGAARARSRARGLRLICRWGIDPNPKRPVRDAAQITRRRARQTRRRAIKLNSETAWKTERARAGDTHDVRRRAGPRAGLVISTVPRSPDAWRRHHGPGGVDYSAPQIRVHRRAGHRGSPTRADGGTRRCASRR